MPFARVWVLSVCLRVWKWTVYLEIASGRERSAPLSFQVALVKNLGQQEQSVQLPNLWHQLRIAERRSCLLAVSVFAFVHQR